MWAGKDLEAVCHIMVCNFRKKVEHISPNVRSGVLSFECERVIPLHTISVHAVFLFGFGAVWV